MADDPRKRDKLWFLKQAPPPGYVAGVGRGATGFTTRADSGAGRTGSLEDDFDLHDSNHDKFAGPKRALFGAEVYEDDDREADAIFKAIDKRMATRKRRSEQDEQKIGRDQQNSQTVAEEFSDIKKSMKDMDASAWEAIPDTSEMTTKRRKTEDPLKDKERYTMIPDSHLLRRAQGQAMDGTVNDAQNLTGSRPPIQVNHNGKAQTSTLQSQLDRLSDNVKGQTVIDPQGYLTSLESTNNALGVSGDMDHTDVAKARSLFKALIKSNPHHAQGYISAARVEVAVGRISAARSIIMKALEFCPDSEEIYLEASKVLDPARARQVMRKGLKRKPNSERLWFGRAEQSFDVEAKRQVYREALQQLPTSVALWKAAVDIENRAEDAKTLLERAVECCPRTVDLWLALAKLEDHKEAGHILNRARQHNPASRDIWLAAASLEESKGNNPALVTTIVKRAIGSLRKQGHVIQRDVWMELARKSEVEHHHPLTGAAIVREVLGLGISNGIPAEDILERFLSDAESFQTQKAYRCAREVYRQLLTKLDEGELRDLRSDQSLLVHIGAADLEIQSEDFEYFNHVVESSLKVHPKAEVLWLMQAKEAYRYGQSNKARQVLSRAFSVNPGSENLWLAALKLEVQDPEYSIARVRGLLSQGRKAANTPRLWLKSAKFEVTEGNFPAALQLVVEGIAAHPKARKLHLLTAHLHCRYAAKLGVSNMEALKVVDDALNVLPHEACLWIMRSEIDLRITSSLSRARSTLERGRKKVKAFLDTYSADESRVSSLKDALSQIWLASVRLEISNDQTKVGQQLLTKALAELPTDGRLWSEAIVLEAKERRRKLAVQAYETCRSDPFVLVALGKMFMDAKVMDKSLQWLTKCTEAHPRFGDSYALRYMLASTDADVRAQIQEEVKEHDPNQGEIWLAIKKDDVRNWWKSPTEILPLAAKAMAQR
eukprot:Clim_evm10s39 gene=Clim_evmTU10s39